MANPSGKICLGFNMENPDHKQVKKILDSLPKGAKSNFVVAAVLEYWLLHDNVIDVRNYRKHGYGVKRVLAEFDDDHTSLKQASSTPYTAEQLASQSVANLESLVSVPVPCDDGNNQNEENEKLEKILLQGLNSFK